MKSSLPPPTLAQLVRFRELADMGCIACRESSGLFRGADIHHVLHAGRRVSHSHTIPLCPWHHRAVLPDHSAEQAFELLGPSLARSKPAFEEAYGTEEELLSLVNKRLQGDCS